MDTTDAGAVRQYDAEAVLTLVSEFREFLQRATVAWERMADAAEHKRRGKVERRALAVIKVWAAEGRRITIAAIARELDVTPPAVGKYESVKRAIAFAKGGAGPRKGRRTVGPDGRPDGGIEAYDDGDNLQARGQEE